MLLITHHTGEPYGLLGPQIVATYLSRKLSLPTIVLGIKRGFNEGKLLEYIEEYYKKKKEKVILCSYHCGRPDILKLCEILKGLGYRIVLGGPQTKKDFIGEENCAANSERVQGFSRIFDLGYSGCVDGIETEWLFNEKGLIDKGWKRDIYVDVDWDNIFVFQENVEKLEIKQAQVLRGIGCPYAKKMRKVLIDPPSFLPELEPVEIEAWGCTFCDVAWDKGYKGNLSDEQVLAQIHNLPEVQGKKIPFELIDEYPIGFLPTLIELVFSSKINISQVNLVLRVDDIIKKRAVFEAALREMKERGIKLFLSSIGFESFSDVVLKNLNKGVRVTENIEAIRIIRELKKSFPETLLYTREEGAVHGLIHPTPWDDERIESEIRALVGAYGLFLDILPYHSTPLIVHHGSSLGRWLREIETRYGIRFNRNTNIIEWWNYRRL